MEILGFKDSVNKCKDEGNLGTTGSSRLFSLKDMYSL